ncbi:MAG: hypothetical protein J6K18_00340 [Bacilli bacterium]|nr:hypothetical protein [Bacilli bacterium]
MPKYNIAGIIVEMNPMFNRTISQAKPYLTTSLNNPDISIELTMEKLEEIKKRYNHLNLEEIEYIFLGQLFYRHILKYNGILLHSSCVVKDNQAYLFSAPSGTGKSTHTNLWLEEFKDAYILNDDKPAIIFKDNTLYAAGTPFSGKHDISKNLLVPIKGICFIERSLNNWIKEISSKQAIFEILNQTERIPYENDMTLILSHIENIVKNTKIYKMGCNISIDAVYTSFNEMSK